MLDEGSNSKKDYLFLRAQTHATPLTNKVFYVMLAVFAHKQGFAKDS
jgi:hypothetical protein